MKKEQTSPEISSSLFDLFFTMFKSGLFAFGGGYAVVALLENELISSKKWLELDEFMNVVTIAESTPGPIAINTATYIGYKLHGVFGSLLATIGVCTPSVVIMCLISLFYNAVSDNPYIFAAFKGINSCVIFLILSAGIKMFKKLKKTPFNIAIFTLVALIAVVAGLFKIPVSSIYYIIACAVLGLIGHFYSFFKERRESK